MATLVLTAIGDDREGLISALSILVVEHDGDWQDSQFARLAGKFAGIALVRVPDSRRADFEATLTSLPERLGWRVEATPVEETGGEQVHVPATGSPLRLHLLGQDRPGMVREVSAALASQHATIDTLRSWTSAMPEGGGVLFEAEAVVRLGEGSDEADLRDALERIAAELMVDLELAAEGAEYGEQLPVE